MVGPGGATMPHMPFSGFSPSELRLFDRLDTPAKIQDFLNGIPINHEPDGDTCLSARRVLRENRAHCMEGAMLAAAILRYHGEKPLVVDLVAAPHDYDHVVAVFRRHGHWGAISKTNHAVLRYREPIYRTIRELALSYFHEYFMQKDGKKTLRSYSLPVDLRRFYAVDWMASDADVWDVPSGLDAVKHYPILNRAQRATLRPADAIELQAGELTEWKARRPTSELS